MYRVPLREWLRTSMCIQYRVAGLAVGRLAVGDLQSAALNPRRSSGNLVIKENEELVDIGGGRPGSGAAAALHFSAAHRIHLILCYGHAGRRGRAARTRSDGGCAGRGSAARGRAHRGGAGAAYSVARGGAAAYRWIAISRWNRSASSASSERRNRLCASRASD